LTAIELGEKEGGVGLRLRATYPFKGDPNGALRRAPSPENAATIAAQPHGDGDEEKKEDENGFIVMGLEQSVVLIGSHVSLTTNEFMKSRFRCGTVGAANGFGWEWDPLL